MADTAAPATPQRVLDAITPAYCHRAYDAERREKWRDKYISVGRGCSDIRDIVASHPEDVMAHFVRKGVVGGLVRSNWYKEAMLLDVVANLVILWLDSGPNLSAGTRIGFTVDGSLYLKIFMVTCSWTGHTLSQASESMN